MKHQFSRDDCSKGGKARQQLPDAAQHQSNAFEMLKAKRPDCWRWIYKNRVKPYMTDRYPGGK